MNANGEPVIVISNHGTIVDDFPEPEALSDDEDDGEEEDDDEIVTLDDFGAQGAGGGEGAANAGAALNVGLATAAAAAAAAREPLKDMNDLPEELLIQILLNVEPMHLTVLSRTSKRLNRITKDLSFRVTYFCRRFDRTEVLYSALLRPKLASQDLLQRLLDNGAHFSRYLAQIVVKSYNSDRHHRHSSGSRYFSANMPFQTYSFVVAEAAKRYGNEMAISRISDDADTLSNLLIIFRRSKLDSDWKPIQQLFDEFNFMFYTRSDPNRIDFVQQIANEPRLAPLATQNGLIVSPEDCDTIMKNVFGDTTKTAEEKASSLSTFIASGLPGLHVSKTMAIKAVLHQTNDVLYRGADAQRQRSTSYGAVKVLADSGKLNFNLSRALADLLLKKRFSRSCLEKLPYLNFILEDYPEIIPVLPRKAALIKFLTHPDYSTDSARQKLHESLSAVRPHMTQSLIVDLVANEFMVNTVPLQYARDFLSADVVDAEVAAYQALTKCLWHPCKGASVLALYDFVDDKEYFKRMLLNELRRWRFDLKTLQPDDPDSNSPEYKKARPVSLLAWNYTGALMGSEACTDEYSQDPFHLRKVGKFTDFPGEVPEETLQSSGSAAAGSSSSANNSVTASGSGSTLSDAARAEIEEELKEAGLPEVNPFLTGNPWSEDNLLYGNLIASHSYHRAADMTQCFSPLSVPLAEAVADIFGTQSEAADIMYAHALMNGNHNITDSYHKRMFFPSLMHLRLMCHLGRRIGDKFTDRLEASPFRKRVYGSGEDEVRGRTKLESPFWCSVDTYPLTAYPGSADATLNFEIGDDHYGFGDNESDDEEINSWRRQARSKKPLVVKGEKADDAAAASPKKRARKSAPGKNAGGGMAGSSSANANAVGGVSTNADAGGSANAAGLSSALVGASTSAAMDTSTDSPAAAAVGLNLSGRPKRKAAADVTYFDDNLSSDEIVEPEDTKAHALELQALTGIGPVKRARGRPRKHPQIVATVVPLPPKKPRATKGKGKGKKGAVAAAAGAGTEGEDAAPNGSVSGDTKAAVISRAKKRKASTVFNDTTAADDDDDDSFVLLRTLEADEIKPVIPLPVFIGPGQLSSARVLQIWETSVPIQIGWKWATFERHRKVAAALEAWTRHVATLLWAETRKHKARKDKVKADALSGNSMAYYHRLRVSKTDAHRCLESIHKRLEVLAAQHIRELDHARAQFLLTIKGADAEAGKVARQRQALVNRIRGHRLRAVEREMKAKADAEAEAARAEAERAGLLLVEGAAAGAVDAADSTANGASGSEELPAAITVAGAVGPSGADADGDASMADASADAATPMGTASAAKEGRGKGRAAKGKGKAKETAPPAAAATNGEGTGEGEGDGPAEAGASASPSRARGRGRGKATTAGARAADKGKGRARSSTAGPTSKDGAATTTVGADDGARVWDEDDAAAADDAGFQSDDSSASLDSAVDSHGKSRRKETGKTADELLKNPNASSSGSRRHGACTSCGSASCPNSHNSHHHIGGGGGGGSTNQTLLAATAIAAAAAGLMYDDDDEEEDDYSYGMYSDEEYDSDLYPFY